MGGREPQTPGGYLFEIRLYPPDPLHGRTREEVDSRQFPPLVRQLLLVALLPEFLLFCLGQIPNNFETGVNKKHLTTSKEQTTHQRLCPQED